MKNLTKKLIVYPLVGVLQFGLGAAVTEASPRQGDWHHGQQPRYENSRHDRDEMRREENDRHEREMQRREYESERAWRERQRLEDERHDRALQALGIALVVGLLLNSQAN